MKKILKILKYLVLTAVAALLVFIVNIIWFKPFSINHYYEKVFIEFVLDEPELISTLGVPVLRGMYNDELGDISPEVELEKQKKVEEFLQTLQSYNKDKQSEDQLLSTKILEWFLTDMVNANQYHLHNYPVNQSSGIQSGMLTFMESSHNVKSKKDALAYIKRLNAFEKKFDQLLEGLKKREDLNIIPPKFVIQKVITEMSNFVNTPLEKNILYASFNTKINKVDDIKEKEILLQNVEDAINNSVFPAYQKLIDYFSLLEEKAITDDGVWKFPNGDEFYAYQVRSHTTLNITPKEIHEIGLTEVARIQNEMKKILYSLEFADTTKNISFYMEQFSNNPEFAYEDSDEGRELCLADYNKIINEISLKIDDYFNVKPKAELEIKRVPVFNEATSPGGYYSMAPMDGSRPGIFYVNLYDIKGNLKYAMPTLAFHEGVPGHHFQISIASELQGVPTFRKLVPFTAYAEGWAMYSEQLAYEMGYYSDKPYANLGRLQSELFRAVRLVVDSGIHYKKWTREEAIEYMLVNTGMVKSEVVSEIERYIVTPGQACAYKIGMIKFLQLREKAKSVLKDKFNIKEFHDVVLKNGAVPLDILDELVNDYINDKPEV
ncbi:MAG: DUF885 domain-containing protein [Bacteroidales bacterium]|nr:DUF885 domain-containing protein [Bacteroidales bacterium]